MKNDFVVEWQLHNNNPQQEEKREEDKKETTEPFEPFFWSFS